MAQVLHVSVGERFVLVDLPDAEREVIPGVRWGDTSLLLTPAWIARHAHIRWRRGAYESAFGQTSVSLAEDMVFCLLGGFGVRAELAEAAYRHLRAEGIFDGCLDRTAIEDRLRTPLPLGERTARYRFPVSRSRYIHDALMHLRCSAPPTDDLALRDYLVAIPGIGPKTASYIVRNHCGSDRVAILDIHVLRAGQAACLFPERATLPRDYAELERRFLAFAQACGVPASILDIIVWEMLRTIPAERRDAAGRLNRRHLLGESGPPIQVGSYFGCRMTT